MNQPISPEHYQQFANEIRVTIRKAQLGLNRNANYRYKFLQEIMGVGYQDAS